MPRTQHNKAKYLGRVQITWRLQLRPQASTQYGQCFLEDGNHIVSFHNINVSILKTAQATGVIYFVAKYNELLA
jgi:hypothetical protein